MGARRKGRELALQALYLADITEVGNEKALAGVLYGNCFEEEIVVFAKRLFKGAAAQKEAIDELIVKYAQNWEMNRMAALDRNLIRLSAYELLYELKTPVSVIIDEAVEIAKTFSTPDSSKFVNGILDRIKSQRKESGQNDEVKAERTPRS